MSAYINNDITVLTSTFSTHLCTPDVSTLADDDPTGTSPHGTASASCNGFTADFFCGLDEGRDLHYLQTLLFRFNSNTHVITVPTSTLSPSLWKSDVTILADDDPLVHHHMPLPLSPAMALRWREVSRHMVRSFERRPRQA